ncbi:TadE/TadG family type IV pilus assembly protein [Agromyces sp. NPDC049794]|uniref:TadE/TadG family type IV pilus assembly protein n=1 Tax=unclassified Agromyces TaxID=2639701 RepID=UPI0033D6A8F2
MRRMIRWVRQERGASAVMFGLLLIPILGFGGIAVDVGALYAEKAELQNGADAAALQIAIACASDEAAAACLSGDPSAIAGGNDSNDGIAVVHDVQVNTTTDLVTAVTKTEDLGVRHPLASMIPGIGDSTVVYAEGAAEWGVPVRGPTLALAIGYCEFAEHPPQEGVLNPTKILVQYETDTRRNCPGAFAPGGFGWLPSTNCSIEIDVADPWVLSKPGNSTANTGCSDEYLASYLEEGADTVFIPIYDDFRGAGGSNVEFHIQQFAAFKITGFKLSGGNAYIDPDAPSCAGSCRGLQGYFMKFVSVSDAFALGSGSGPGTGAAIVRLTLRTS